MSAPSICIAFDNVDEHSSIGSLCAWAARTALAAGWRVSVLARDLSPDLRADVEWLRFAIPPRLHAVQWFSALPSARRSLAGRTWDVVHVQQPQLAPLGNVLQLHYLVRAARQRQRNVGPLGPRQRIGRAQVRLTEQGESWFLSRLDDSTRVLAVSGFLRDEFRRLYGEHPHLEVLANPAPEIAEPFRPEEVAEARAKWGLPTEAFVIGFLGGDDPRKGGAELLAALRDVDAVVLYAGNGRPPGGSGEKVRPIGYVEDRRGFFAACDAFAAVSSFDPAPLAVLEAAAHGVPVIGTPWCGTVLDLAESGAAVLWEPGTSLAAGLSRLHEHRARLSAAGTAAGRARSASVQAAALLAFYAEAAAAGPVPRR